MPLEMWHLSYFFSPDEIDAIVGGKAFGYTLISPRRLPLGFGGIFFQQNGEGQAIAVLFFYGGPNQIFVKKYTKIALRAATQVFAVAREMGIHHVYAVADKGIPASERFVRHLGGEPIGADQAEGEIFVIHLKD